MLELLLLIVPGCPNGPIVLERLADVLADYPDARVTRQVVQDEADALRLGLHGSPTLLVNGIDPFLAPGTPAALVYAGRQEACGTCAASDAAVPSVAADECCGFINFFASRDGAVAWAAAHPEVTGQILSQRKALLAGIQIFGSLLRAIP